MLRRYRKYIIIAFGCLVIFGVAFIGFYLWSLAPPNPDGVPREIVIEKGSGQRDIAQLLYNEGLIRNQQGFLLYVQWSDTYKNLQAGTYQLSSAMGVREIVRKLTEGVVEDFVQITLPEGLTLQEMDELLAENGVLKKGTFQDGASLSAREAFDKYKLAFLENLDSETLEGFLFPDTYEFYKDTDTDIVIEAMLENFEKRIGDEFPDVLGSDSFLDTIIIASILEKEVQTEEDMKLVAGLIQNRRESNMFLNMDSTVKYFSGETTARGIAQAKNEDNPYNTYRVKGLPPSPIGNPGVQAIRSVLEPTPSDYVYFLNEEDGTTHYAKNSQEHQINIERYLR